mmetsp:Transcript_90321/g.234226  ORF Transcript_90321/g.234226 Transcript_90321/m.234226 type:complete len:130 (+) Transcript_90321:213-602(+)
MANAEQAPTLRRAKGYKRKGAHRHSRLMNFALISKPSANPQENERKFGNTGAMVFRHLAWQLHSRNYRSPQSSYVSGAAAANLSANSAADVSARIDVPASQHRRAPVLRKVEAESMATPFVGLLCEASP